MVWNHQGDNDAKMYALVELAGRLQQGIRSYFPGAHWDTRHAAAFPNSRKSSRQPNLTVSRLVRPLGAMPPLVGLIPPALGRFGLLPGIQCRPFSRHLMD